MATATKERASVQIVFSPKDHIDYGIFKKLKANRFNNAYTNHYLTYRGPETEQAWQVAQEIVTHFNQKKDDC